ncbi:MAG TPA: chlorite dismutase family protein [Fimbriimonadaceae bacterium]|nr:chlorite dismutase family protein [Fimbriimonadaceae bacterium]
MSERLLNLFATYAFTDAYWSSGEKDRHSVRQKIAQEAKELARATHFYSVFPARSDTDFLLWSAWEIDEKAQPHQAFARYGAATEGWRRFVKPVQSLWGFTRVSQYSRGKSEQDMDPINDPRAAYLVVYPFSKTKEWYLMSMDARQGMMNEHIKMGKQYFDIKQLLLYSFGIQDQEFVVSYEMDDLTRFSDLVNTLRSAEGRKYTLLDTPLVTGFYQSVEDFVR